MKKSKQWYIDEYKAYSHEIRNEVDKRDRYKKEADKYLDVSNTYAEKDIEIATCLLASAKLLNLYSNSDPDVESGRSKKVAKKIPVVKQSEKATRKFTQFFKGEMNRHHTEEVADVVRQLKIAGNAYSDGRKSVETAIRRPNTLEELSELLENVPKPLEDILNEWAQDINSEKFNEKGELAKILSAIVQVEDIEMKPQGLGALIGQEQDRNAMEP